MSGLLRRIKRSRDADAGEPPLGGEAAPPDAAPTPAEPVAVPATPPAEVVPAGLDPTEGPLRPPAGRRGRLRRRLRYLRRARELMLRDLGGLLYEVHRTGGGEVDPHATVIGAKVQRLTTVDAEAHAIEHALSSPRGETVVFQPGVGGTCAVCGELYGSAARFCSNCGAAVGAAPAATPASFLAPATSVPAGDEQPTAAIAAEPKPSRWRRGAKRAQAVGEPAGDATPSEKTTADTAAAPTAAEAAEESTDTDPTAADAAPVAEAPAAEDPADAAPTTADAAADAPTADDSAPAADAAAPAAAAPTGERQPDETPEPSSDGQGNPLSGNPANGREEHAAPELSSGDPLVTRERS
jgi:hypothetical protein